MRPRLDNQAWDKWVRVEITLRVTKELLKLVSHLARSESADKQMLIKRVSGRAMNCMSLRSESEGRWFV